MLIEFLGEILVEGLAYGTYGLMELFLDSLYKGWNKTKNEHCYYWKESDRRSHYKCSYL